MKAQAMNRATAVICLMCGIFASSCGGSDSPKPSTPTETPEKPLDPNTFLPFDPKDEDASFTATLRIEDREGGHPAASLTYAGTTYDTDGDGKIVIPNVKVAAQEGLSITSEGFLPRSVVLDYQSAGGDEGLRVVLEKPGVVREFASTEAADVTHGSVQLEFPANAFAKMDGSPYTGMVTVSALGIDPVASVIQMDENGFALRPDFDLDRIPQGFGLAIDADDNAHFVLPESVFSAEISTSDGEPLQLQTGKQATYKFSLSAMTERKEGEVIPTFTFDEKAQRWIEDGSCTVQSTEGGKLECVGQSTHFSTWMISSGANSTNPSCGNYNFRIKADSKYEAKPVSVKITDIYGRDTIDGVMTGDTGVKPAMVSTSGMCFFQAQPFAFVRVEITLRQAARSGGSTVDDKFIYVLGKGASKASDYDKNLQLVRAGEITAADVNMTKVDADCLKCPPSFVDIDLRTETPMSPETPATGCAATQCGQGATCVGSGTCVCAADKQYKNATEGCVTPSCDAPNTWDATQLTCAPVDPCMTNNGGCSADATCKRDASFKAVCTCKPGYTGNGQSCTTMTACSQSPCMHGGTCTPTSDSYSCACPSGWSGANCQTNVNECAAATSPCDGDKATCLDNDGSFACSCKTGYTGSGKPGTCTNVNACTNNPCANGFTCTDLAAPAPDSSAGRTCSDVNECDANNGGCGDHGECANTDGGFSCTCATGYAQLNGTGACVDVDACIANPCEQGFVCTDMEAPAPNTVEGRTCQESGGGDDPDACDEFPCDQGETCTDLPNPAANSEEGRICTPKGGGSGTGGEGGAGGAGGGGGAAGGGADPNACESFPCDQGEYCEDLANPAPDSADGRTCTENPDACIEFECGSGEVCSDLPPPAPNSAEGRDCSNFDACKAYPCEQGQTCEDLPPPANSTPEGRTCAPVGGGGGEADLTSGTPGDDVPLQGFDNLTRGIEVQLASPGSSVFITGVRIDGLDGQPQAHARIYDASGNLGASGMNTSVTSSSATISLTQSYLVSFAPVRVAVWTFEGDGTATLFEPMAFPYIDSSGTFTVLGGYSGDGDEYPTTSQDAIPQITVLYESASSPP